MPSYNLIETLLQRPDVERTREANGDREVVGGDRRLEVMEEPDTLLRERDRK
jgi:hypothetical protein